MLTTGARVRIGRTIVVCVLLALLMGGCRRTVSVPMEGARRIAVPDFRGRTITLDRPAERIVCLLESALSGLYMLGVDDRIVAIPRDVYEGNTHSWYASLDERIRDRELPAPGNWDFVNIESVLALRPDLVIVWSRQVDSIRLLENQGIAVCGIELGSFGDVYREIALLGTLTGTTARAEALIEFTRGVVEEIRGPLRSIPRSERPRVYFMWAQGMLETAGGPSTAAELLELGGAINVAGGIDLEHATITLEQIVAWDADAVVMWYNERKDPRDVLEHPHWQTIKAVRDKRVHEFPEVFLCDFWTLKFPIAAIYVASWCHPRIFDARKADSRVREILSFLYADRLPHRHD